MPINSPDIFNSVGDATLSGGTSGTVTEVDAGTGLETAPASGIVTTGTIGIADTGVSAGTYKSGGGQFTVNAQGQITSASSGVELVNMQADISPTILNGNNVLLQSIAVGKIFLPTSLMTVCTSGTGQETQKGAINIFYSTGGSSSPCYTIADRMFGLSSAGTIRTGIGDASTSMSLGFSAVAQNLFMTSAVTFAGNWTGKLFLTGVLFPVT